MKFLLFTVGLCTLMAVVMSRPDWDFPIPDSFPEYGPNVERDGFCPRTPRESLCDTNFCNQDNNCEEVTQRCCPVVCGGLMCVDPIPGVRRAGNCPDFWTVPVEKWPATPINECDTDENCPNSAHKCCGTDTSGIRKCVNPA